MAKAGTYRGGRRVKAGSKPEALTDAFGEIQAYVDGDTNNSWMSINYEDVEKCWNFASDRFMAKENADYQCATALWSTRHGNTANHANYVSSDSANWLIAYNGTVVSLNKSMKYVLANDITINESVTDTLTGYAICLNGYNVKRNNSIPHSLKKFK